VVSFQESGLLNKHIGFVPVVPELHGLLMAHPKDLLGDVEVQCSVYIDRLIVDPGLRLEPGQATLPRRLVPLGSRYGHRGEFFGGRAGFQGSVRLDVILLEIGPGRNMEGPKHTQGKIIPTRPGPG
jgi:hypothetical protein